MQDLITNILRKQALHRAIGELKAAQATYYDGEADNNLLYQAIERAIKEIKDNC